MAPISRIVDSTEVFSHSDSHLSSDSILIKWRPMTIGGGEVKVGAWDNDNHTVVGGVLVSWLVSLSSDRIMGFILRGQLSFVSFTLSLSHLLQIPSSPQLISFTSFNTPTCQLLANYSLTVSVIAAVMKALALFPSLVQGSRSQSLPIQRSRHRRLPSMFQECLRRVSIS